LLTHAAVTVIDAVAWFVETGNTKQDVNEDLHAFLTHWQQSTKEKSIF